MKAQSTKKMKVANVAQINSVTLTVVPFIQKGCWNCGILFRAWFDTGWIWVPCLRMVRLEFYFYICVFQAASWLHFFLPRVCFMHAPCHSFPIGVKNTPPPPSTCVSALNQHRWNMYNMTENCFFNHEGFHRAWLPRPHCRFISWKK